MILMAPHCAFCPTMTSMATSFTTHTTQQICAAVVRPMSVMGQERRSDGMSALLPKADLTERDRHVREGWTRQRATHLLPRPRILG